MTVNAKSISTFSRDFYKQHPIISNLLFICAAIVILVGIGLLFLNIWTNHGSTATIPNVSNFSYDNALNVLKAEGFHAEISDSVYDNKLKPGTVISTWPRPGAVVKPGREVYLTIASFQPRKVRVTMPLNNVSSRQALKYLESLNIKNVRIVNVPSQFADLVLGAKYDGKDILPGALLPINAQVTLEVGTVPTITEVDPDSELYEPLLNDDNLEYSTSAAYD